MLVLNIKKFFESKVTILLFSVIGVLIILSILIYTLSMKSNIFNGMLIDDIMGKIGAKNNVLNMENFYTEFEVTIVSNKNTNTYNMKEWYKKDVGSKVEYLDNSNSKVNILIKKDNITLKNENQKNTLIINPYVLKYSNLLSINTFINIYNKSKEKECCFSANSYEKANNINMILENICKNKDKCECEFVDIVNSVSKLELKLDKNSGLPLTYIVYDNDKKECISIVYNRFDINTDIKNSIFDL